MYIYWVIGTMGYLVQQYKRRAGSAQATNPTDEWTDLEALRSLSGLYRESGHPIRHVHGGVQKEPRHARAGDEMSSREERSNFPRCATAHSSP